VEVVYHGNVEGWVGNRLCLEVSGFSYMGREGFNCRSKVGNEICSVDESAGRKKLLDL